VRFNIHFQKKIIHARCRIASVVLFYFMMFIVHVQKQPRDTLSDLLFIFKIIHARCRIASVFRPTLQCSIFVFKIRRVMKSDVQFPFLNPSHLDVRSRRNSYSSENRSVFSKSATWYLVTFNMHLQTHLFRMLNRTYICILLRDVEYSFSKSDTWVLVRFNIYFEGFSLGSFMTNTIFQN